ncbi:MAG: porin, partial [Hyphomicrobiaceae bacterium]
MIGGLLKSASSTALFAALGLIALGAGGVPVANAADLGGDCCADLEERVAELEATTARKGNRKVSLTISGQVTTHLMYWNDGNNTQGSDTYVVDNVAAGGTFINFGGSAKITPNLTAGFQLAFSFFNGSRSHQVSQLDDDGGNGGDTNIVSHLSNWYIDHKQLGRITLGRINTATAGITTIDLGGAGVIANASFGYWQRGMNLALNDNLLGAGTWSAALGGNDVNGASLSRANAISYTSPTFGGFSVAAAWGEDDIWDVAVRYAGEFSGFRLAAGVGYINNSSGLNEVVKDHAVGDEPNIWKGSASVLHVASGLFL